MTKRDKPGFWPTLFHRASEGVGKGEEFEPWTKDVFPRTYGALNAMRKIFIKPPKLPDGFVEFMPWTSSKAHQARDAWIEFIEKANDDVGCSKLVGDFTARVFDEVDTYFTASLTGPIAFLRQQNVKRIREKILTKAVSDYIGLAIDPIGAVKDEGKRRVKIVLSATVMGLHQAASSRLEEWKETSDLRWREKWGIKTQEEQAAATRQLLIEKGLLDPNALPEVNVSLTDRLIDITNEKADALLERRVKGPSSEIRTPFDDGPRPGM